MRLRSGPNSVPVGRLTLKSRGSEGLRQKSPEPTSLKPAASISLRNTLSSMRCRVLPIAVPSPAFAEWSAITNRPPGLSAA